MEKIIGSFSQTSLSGMVSRKLFPKTEFLYSNIESNISTNKNLNIYVFGNIYNLKEIAAEAGFTNPNFNELILELFEKNISWIKKFDGEFTIIIFKDNTCHVIRDRHGASMQIYYNTTHFCSNIFMFNQLKGFKPEINASALGTFLAYGYIPSPDTALKGIKELPAGSWLTFKNGHMEIKQLFPFHEFTQQINNSITIDEASQEFERLHKDAIATRINGKTEVGAFLSGGYDSGGNIHNLRQIYNGKIKAYSIGFKNNPWSELPLSRIMAERYNADYQEYEIDGSEINFLPDIISELGDPFQESGLMINYLVNKLVSKNRPEIIIGGDGNDQHFGVAMRELAYYHRFKTSGFLWTLKTTASVLGGNAFEKDNFLYKLRFHCHKMSHILENDRFGFSPSMQKSILKNYSSFKPAGNIGDAKTHNFDELCRIKQFHIDLGQIVNEVILFKGSKMAAMFNNNLSFPYMSTPLYDFLKTLPRQIKTKGDVKSISQGKGSAKYLHKYSLKPHLPSEITDRKKQGGFAPLPVFFENDNQRLKLFSYINDSLFANDFCNQNSLLAFLNNYNSLTQKPAYWFWYRQSKATQIWNLLVISIWWDLMNKKSISF